MAYGSGRVVTPIRAWVLGVLAITALLTRVPWGRLGVDVDLPVLTQVTPWQLTDGAIAETVSVGVEFALIWVLVFVTLPALYPSRARQLTTSLPFRAVVSGLTTAVSVTVFFIITRQLSPAALAVLVATTLVVTVAMTSSRHRSTFASPYIDPTFAVLTSFVPTSRIGEFADLFRTGVTDARTRIVCHALLGVVTTGVVLVVGALAALSTLASPTLELLTLTGLLVVFGRRLLPALPTRWRLRFERTARRLRRRLWVVRRLLTDPRGSAATLLVTAGFLLGTTAGALAVAVAASAVRRTSTFGTLSLSPTGGLAEWVVAAALAGYAGTVMWFWWRSARWLPGFLAADKARRESPLHRPPPQQLDRPPGLLVPQSLLLVAALWSLYPGSSPLFGPNPVVPLAVTLLALGWSLAGCVGLGRESLSGRVLSRVAPFTTREALTRLARAVDDAVSTSGEHELLVTARARLSALAEREDRAEPWRRDWVALPLAFSVQWLGTAVALVALPGTEAATVWPTTWSLLVVVLGGYFYVDLRDGMAKHGIAGSGAVSLFLFTLLVAVLVWVANGRTLPPVFG